MLPKFGPDGAKPFAAPGQPEHMTNGVGYVLSELIVGIAEVSVLAGLTEIVSVFYARIFRVLKAAVREPRIIGRPQRIGDVMAYAGLLEAGPSVLRHSEPRLASRALCWPPEQTNSPSLIGPP